MADAAQFRRNLAQFIEDEVPKRVVSIQKRMTADLLAALVINTPVGNATKWKHNILRAQRGLPPLPKGYVGGHAKRNWQVKLIPGVPPIRAGVDNSGQATIAEGSRESSKIPRPSVAYIVNPLPYIQRLEEGHSRQKPNGFVRQAIASIIAKYQVGP